MSELKDFMAEGASVIYAVYRHPTDYPDKYVVRRWWHKLGITAVDNEPLVVADTLEEARQAVPPGMAEMRHPNDDLAICEVWI